MDNNHVDETMNDNVKTSDSDTRKRICLIDKLAQDEDILAASKLFKVPVITSETGEELVDDRSWMTYFVVSEFEGPVFDSLHKSSLVQKHKYDRNSTKIKIFSSFTFRILGPPAFIASAESHEGLPSHNRPVYNYSMKGVVTAFTGIRKRDELVRLKITKFFKN